MMSSTPRPSPPRTEAEALAWLRLIRSRRVGPATFHRLMAEHGSAEAALTALPRIAAEAGLEGYTAQTRAQAETELALGRRHGLQPVYWGETAYPTELATLPDAPPVLWRKGCAQIAARPMVALVGARNASSLGRRMAARLAEELGAAGLVTVSGLARGIDTAAHAAALPTGTVAVMGGGLAHIYPPENRALAEAICETGALFSEFAPEREAQSRHFPARNRLISGMSLGVIVVEAAERSGSLHTARNALDQGREVMAVPGHPVDPRAAGGNLLIRDGAALIRSLDDILEAIGPAFEAARTRATAQGFVAEPRPAPTTDHTSKLQDRSTPRNHLAPHDQLPPPPGTAAAARAMVARAAPHHARLLGTSLAQSAQRLREAILGRLSASPLPEDNLLRELALPPSQVLPELLALEIEGQIRRQPGGALSRAV